MLPRVASVYALALKVLVEQPRTIFSAKCSGDFLLCKFRCGTVRSGRCHGNSERLQRQASIERLKAMFESFLAHARRLDQYRFAAQFERDLARAPTSCERIEH